MGHVHEAGWECLSESTRLLPKVYPEFDYVICYNNLEYKEVERLKSFGIPLHEQTADQIELPHESIAGVADHFWKLCPVRLRPEAHEVWVDNDIVIRERIPEVDSFLTQNTAMISQAWGREKYGRFDPIVPKTEPWTCCAGFFGLPPHFPFKEKCLDLCDGEPLQGFDEQGMVASIVTSTENWIPIQSWHLRQEGWWEPIREITKSTHFIRLNTGTNSAWETHKLLTHPEPKIAHYSKWMYNKTKKRTESLRSWSVL